MIRIILDHRLTLLQGNIINIYYNCRFCEQLNLFYLDFEFLSTYIILCDKVI